MNIKPIETVYNGYRFRSRLEARWAVFFDSAGIEYQYEPEGFELDNGVRYLPDFYLPDFDMYFEVKANTPNAINDVERYASMLIENGLIKAIVFLSDIPGECDGGLWHFPCIYRKNGRVNTGWFFFCDRYEMSCTGHISAAQYQKPFELMDDKICINSNCADSFCLSAISDIVLDPNKWKGEPYDSIDFDCVSYQFEWNKRTFTSFRKARQARFEHGEAPT